MKLENKNKSMEYILKVCRVHNVIDLNRVINNGATMIGVHAVYIDREKYLLNEKKYLPIEQVDNINPKLPVALFEIDSIRNMQKYISDNIEQAILFQRPISIELMKECCKIYNMPIDKIYIQLHHRTNKRYINLIKKKMCKRIIAVVGIYQKDFKEYFWYIHNSLNPKTDYILIDLSVHQSDLSNYDNNLDKLKRIEEIGAFIENNKVPIIIADDTNVEQMKKYLKKIKSHQILLKGIDMQNTVEIKKSEQKYEVINEREKKYLAKIRKSSKLLGEWKNFLIEEGKEYFEN